MTAPGGDPGIQLIPVGTQNSTRLGYVDNNLTKILVNDNDTSIWVDSQSGVSVNNGLVVKGRTSINWTRPGQIWAIRETGTETGDTNVAVCSAADQWQPSPVDIGVAVAAELIISGIPFTERSTPVIYDTDMDASTYNSVIGAVSNNFTFGGAVNQAVHVFSHKTASGLTLNRNQALQITPDYFPVRLPLYGPKFRFNTATLNAAGGIIGNPALPATDRSLLYLSSRVVPQPYWGGGAVDDSISNPVTPGNSESCGLLLGVAAVPLANLATKTWYLPLFSGRVGIRVGGGACNFTFQFSFAPSTTADGVQFNRAAGANDSYVEYLMPGEQGTFTITNNSGAAANYWVTIHPLDY